MKTKVKFYNTEPLFKSAYFILLISCGRSILLLQCHLRFYTFRIWNVLAEIVTETLNQNSNQNYTFQN